MAARRFNPERQPQMPYPNGVLGSMEDRITRLEMHSFYAERERQALESEIEDLRGEISEVRADRQALLRTIGFFALGVVGSIVLWLADKLWSLVSQGLTGVTPGSV